MGDARPTHIAVFLQAYGARPGPAQTAAKSIAAAWADHYFFTSYTRQPLEKCVINSPEVTATADELLRHLTRRFGVFVHDVPAWQPHR
ncbi:MAG: hypothetical protein ACRDMV_18255 [Streptosporangiales bacterium]